MKRLLVIADTHCGHMAGLTPPGWQLPADSESIVRRKFADWERYSWNWFEEAIDKVRPFDALIWNGDILDGKGERSGGTELIMSDRNDQIAIAKRIYEYIKPPSTLLIYGTPYHVGRDEDWERVLADQIGCHIGTHEWPEAEDVIFDIKHKVSSSVIPHGRHTGPSRARLWNQLWAERAMQPKAQLVIRSHVHYYDFSGDIGGVAITTPALQGWTKYGGRECEGTVDYGFLTVDCEDGKYEWKPHVMDLQSSAAKTWIV